MSLIAPRHRSPRIEGSAKRILAPQPAKRLEQPVSMDPPIPNGYEGTAPRGNVTGNVSNAKDGEFSNEEGAHWQFAPWGFGGGATPYPQSSGFPGGKGELPTSGVAPCTAGTGNSCEENTRFSDPAPGLGSQNVLGALWDDFPIQDPFGPDGLAAVVPIDGENPAMGAEAPPLAGNRPAEVPEPPTAFLMFGELLSWWIIGALRTRAKTRYLSVREQSTAHMR